MHYRKLILGILLVIVFMVTLLLVNYFRPEKRKIRHYTRGIIYAKQGNMGSAIKEFRFALSIAPLSHDIRFALAKAYAAIDNKEETKKQLQQILVNLPSHSKACQALVNIYREEKDYPKALEHCLRFLKKTPQDVPVLNSYGLVLSRMGQKEKSEQAFQKAILLDPQNSDAHLHLARLYWNTKREKTAINLAQLYLAKQPDNYDLRLQLGRFFQAQKKNKEAVEQFSYLYKTNPDFINKGAPYLAVSWLKSGDLKNAVHLSQQALAATPSKLNRNPILVYVQARGLMKEKRYAEALKELEWAKKAWEKQVLTPPGELLYALSVAYVRVQKSLLAITELENLLRKFPTFLPARELIIQQYMKQRQLDKAYYQCEETLSLFSSNKKVLFLKVKILLEKGDIQEAKDVCEDLSLYASNSRETQMSLILLAISQKKYEEALQLLHKIETKKYQNTYTTYLIARCYFFQKKLHQALKFSYQVLEKSPKFTPNLLLLAEIRVFQGNLGEASKIYTRLIKVLPQSKELVINLINLYLQRKKAQQAQKVLAQSIWKNSTSPMILESWGKIYFAQEDFQTALDYFKKIPRRTHSLYTLLADSHARMKDYRTAVDFYSIAEKIGDNPQIQLKKAISLYLQRRNIEASLVLESYLEKKPDNDLAQIFWGEILYHLGDESGALYKIQEIIEKQGPYAWIGELIQSAIFLQKGTSPSFSSFPLSQNESISSSFREELGRLVQFCQKEKVRLSPLPTAILFKEMKEAWASWSSYEEISPLISNQPFALYIKATLLDQQGKSMEGRSILEKLVQMEGAIINVYIKLAILFMQKRDFKKAQELLQSALFLESNSPHAIVLSALCAQNLKQTKPAVAYYKQFLALPAKEQKHNLKMLTYKNLARLLLTLDRKHFQPAHSYAKKAYAENPYDADTVNTLGWSYYRRNDYDNALENFSYAHYLDPDNLDIQYRLAVAYARKAKWKTSQKTVVEILKQKRTFKNQDKAKKLLRYVIAKQNGS